MNNGQSATEKKYVYVVWQGYGAAKELITIRTEEKTACLVADYMRDGHVERIPIDEPLVFPPPGMRRYSVTCYAEAGKLNEICEARLEYLLTTEDFEPRVYRDHPWRGVNCALIWARTEAEAWEIARPLLRNLNAPTHTNA